MVQEIMRKQDRDVLHKELQSETVELKSIGYVSRVLDETGRVLIQTPGMGSILPASLSFPAPYGADDELDKGTKWATADGRVFLIMAAWAGTGGQAEKKHLIQVGMDVSDDDTLLTEYRRKLGYVLVIGLLFSTAAGIAVARRGMRPLKEITEIIQRITATQLHERIIPERWPEELVSLAAAFDQMLDRLEDSFTRLSRFSADLAHELRTPINNLRGEAEVSLSRARTPDEYRQSLESGLEEYARLSRMIDILLFLARAESGKVMIEKSGFDAGKEIDTVLEMYEALADEQGIKVTRIGSARLEADPALFRRALSNLLDNAFHYTPHGGKISVLIKEREGRTVEVQVADSGIGIEGEALSSIFDRFYRTDRARARYPEGSGLGLSIVRSIMYLHGGDITVHSRPSEGTTVVLRLPQPAAPSA
jgi:two-component system heavy metal sensor histidine kinase CusS